MRIHQKEIIYEDRRWKVTALRHVNGSYSGRIMDKTDKIATPWMRTPRLRKPYIIPDVIPKHMRDRVQEIVELLVVNDTQQHTNKTSE